MDWILYLLIVLCVALYLGWGAWGFIDGRTQSHWLFLAISWCLMGLLQVAVTDWFDRLPWWDFHPNQRWQGLLFFGLRGVATFLGRWSLSWKRLDPT